MKSSKFKMVVLALVWFATAGAAYWAGISHGGSASNKNTAANNRNKTLTDHGSAIILNTINQAVPTTKDLEAMKGKRPDADALKAWADGLDPAQCPGLLDELEKMEGGQPRDAMIAAMIASWSARDPQGYLKDYTNVADPRARETGVDGALKALAASDPKAALAFMTDSSEALPNQLMARRYRATLQGYAADDPAGALSYVQGLDTNTTLNAQVQRQGLQAVADALASNGNFTQALTMFSSLPAAQSATANAELMNQWAQLAPGDASKYVASMTDPTQQATAAAQVARTWARDDPAAAAAWAAQLDASTA
ncbi:MAG TPA: hypothetical protein VK737_12450, partial [Opitutales bacterium]|nr:hypothetical protein [Opitutales bacterium]